MIAVDAVEAPEQVSADPRTTGIYHFLDVGGLQYGDCILVEFGDIRILIDGSHEVDYRGQRGYESIPDQLRRILGGQPPYDITLLVVTHGHADHIGCLPDLVEHEIIRPRHALLTDPKWGFGRTAGEDVRFADSGDPGLMLEAALREEDAGDLDDDELAAFIDAASRVEARYGRFIERLQLKEVDIVFYRGPTLPARLARELEPTGLTLLGPTEDQLIFCAEQIATTNQEARDAADLNALDSRENLIDLYRAIVGTSGPGDVRNPRGSGMNCQSITMAFGPPGARVLLAGDMQFSHPNVVGADEEVERLRAAVAAAGPYKVFKATHHTAHNGQDQAFLTELGNPPVIIHSGGLRDDDHPNPAVLRMLGDRDDMLFARTDRNGRITVRPHLRPDRAVKISRGRLNDFSPNVREDEPGESPERRGAPAPATREPPAAPPAPTGAGPQVIIVNLPPGPIDMSVGGVEICIRSVGGSASAASSVDPGGQGQPRHTGGRTEPVIAAVGGGRTNLPKLLFVTDPAKLRANIGTSEADAALAAVERSHGTLVVGSGDTLLANARRSLQADADIQGIVLLGGYDVVPSLRMDVLGDVLRTRLGNQVYNDNDEFWVWSDQAYGDSDGDSVAELPVSRIPDGRDGNLFIAALQSRGLTAGERFGIRNVARPFASAIWHGIAGTHPLNISEPFLSGQVQPGDLDSGCHYFMLHGSDTDGREFTGEDAAGDYPVAFDVDRVPAQFSGVVFTGCCWGALVVEQKAVDGGGVPQPRIAESSIALSYLRAGAVAFIGCTGSHYSGPSTDPNANYAARLHEAFWSRLAGAGFAPALALHHARNDYGAWIAEAGRAIDPLVAARRLKNFSQFTCLGLGW